MTPRTDAAAHPHVQTKTVSNSIESWYSSAPIDTCSSPLGCTSLPVSPYPKDTLHVGIAGGQPTAETVLLPDLAKLPLGSTTVSGTMTLPLATGNQDGTSNADTSTPLACLATSAVKDGEAGSTGGPTVDCKVSAKPKYLPAKGGTFTLDLTPFLTAWRTGKPAYGIVLEADPAQRAPSENWSLAFNDRHTDAPAHLSSTIKVTLAPVTPVAPLPTPTHKVATPPKTGGGAITPPSGGGGGGGITLPSGNSQPAGTGPAPQVAGAPSAAPPVVAGGQQLSGFVSGKFQYPIVFLMPLLLFAGGAFLARLFTRDATPLHLR